MTIFSVALFSVMTERSLILTPRREEKWSSVVSAGVN
jgi:hypothetical protein